MDATNITKIVDYRLAQEIEKHTTWHILHAIISSITFGLWAFVWVFITSHRREKRLTAYRHAESLYRGISMARSPAELRANQAVRPALKFYDLE